MLRCIRSGERTRCPGCGHAQHRQVFAGRCRAQIRDSSYRRNGVLGGFTLRETSPLTPVLLQIKPYFKMT